MKHLAILLLCVLATPAFAIVKECSTYPLITYPEREIIKKSLKGPPSKSTEWGKLTTKQRISVCRSLANILRKQ